MIIGCKKIFFLVSITPDISKYLFRNDVLQCFWALSKWVQIQIKTNECIYKKNKMKNASWTKDEEEKSFFLITEVTLGCQLVKYDLKVKATKSNNRFEPVTFLYSSFYLLLWDENNYTRQRRLHHITALHLSWEHKKFLIRNCRLQRFIKLINTEYALSNYKFYDF